MVFVLRHVLHGEALILGLNRSYTLGKSRRNDIHLTDVSVDKIHATLETTGAYADIEDKNSEHGTWVNKQRITQPFRLRNGDVIVFGKSNCKYVFLESKFEAIIDKNISKTTRCMLEQTLKELNITLTKTYTRTCTHYIIEHVSFDTLKEKTMLYHLINRLTVVTPKYFLDILTNIKEAPLMPNIYRYMPEVDPQLKIKGIEDISPRKKRRHIFENTMFIFFDKECDKDLTNLVLKCGGDTILYSQNQDFFKELFRDMNRYEYISVNHCEDNKKPPQMSSFLKTMRHKRKKVSCVCLADLYISVFKGDLVGVYNEHLPRKMTSKEPQPSSSKLVDTINLDSSDDEKSSGSVDIVCQIIKTSSPKTSTPITTFGRLAAAYKEQKTLKETVLAAQVSAPTLNKWINRFNKRNTDGDQTGPGKTNENNQDNNQTNVLTDDETQSNLERDTKCILNTSQISAKKLYRAAKGNKRERLPEHNQTKISTVDETQCDLGVNVKHVSSAPQIPTKNLYPVSLEAKTNKRQRQDAKKRKLNVNGQYKITDGQETRNNRKEQDEREDRGQDTNSANSDGNRRKKIVVVNPYALKNTPRRTVPGKQSRAPSTLDEWIRKYKNADIIPMP